MAELQITVKTRTLERMIYIIIILVLLVFVIMDFFEDSGTSDNTSDNNGHNDEENAAAQATCSDGIKNQDETNIDCGGTCGGYWYESTCNAEPQDTSTTNEVECRLHSDCEGDMYMCRNGECVFEPECEQDSDCDEGYTCEDNACEEIPLSGAVTYTIGNIDGSGTDFIRVEEVQLSIENGRPDTIFYQFDVWIYYKESDYLADQKINTNPIPVGQIAPGQTVSKYYNINPKRGLNSNSGKPYDEDWTIKIKFYDLDGNLVGTKQKVFIPEDTL
ncbi:hypothetical protein JW868_03215 [Candidatus Woesearchaeota archaeon]|nr:hypothetical protein [Candidatus Woesearchaeota archaeon]